jgi:hypothetical protein
MIKPALSGGQAGFTLLQKKRALVYQAPFFITASERQVLLASLREQ